MCAMRGRAGQIVGSGFSGKKSQLGVRMTSAVKKLGCSNLRTLIEDDKLATCDYDIISRVNNISLRERIHSWQKKVVTMTLPCVLLFSLG
jgi:hypothetical protein